MKRSGEIVLLNGNVAPALNAFGQVAMPTGLSAGGNDAFLILGGTLEFDVACGGAATRATALSRASKTSVPALSDDDVLLKDGIAGVFTTSGLAYVDLTRPLVLPPQALVIVESNIYLQFKTTGQTAVMACNAVVWVERVTLADSEKSAILSQRLNNLLN